MPSAIVALSTEASPGVSLMNIHMTITHLVAFDYLTKTEQTHVFAAKRFATAKGVIVKRERFVGWNCEAALLNQTETDSSSA